MRRPLFASKFENLTTKSQRWHISLVIASNLFSRGDGTPLVPFKRMPVKQEVKFDAKKAEPQDLALGIPESTFLLTLFRVKIIKVERVKMDNIYPVLNISNFRFYLSSGMKP